jgi:hypothetical protein
MSDIGKGDAERGMHPSLRLVSERLRQVRDRATRLFEHDLDFRDLCEEYEACVATMTRLQYAGPSSEGMRKEYAALVLRLDRELLRYMEEHADRKES